MPKFFLRRFLTLLFVVLALVLGTFTWYILSSYFASEISFRRHVSYLNFEQAGYRLRESLQRDYTWGQGQASLEPPIGFLRLRAKPELVAGSVSQDLLATVKTDIEQQLLFLSGSHYLIRRWESSEAFVWQNQNLGPGVYGIVWQLKPETLNLIDIPFAGQLWLLNLQGQLLMSSDPQAKSAEVLRKPLVQKFIQSPLNRFQIPVESEDKQGAFGFAMLIPDSNMVLCAEIPLRIWVSPIFKTLGKASLILIAGFLLVGILARSYVLSLREQVMNLAKILENFSGGYFIPPEMSEMKVFRELEPIHSAVAYSTKRVRQRLNELEREVQTGEQA